GLRRAGGFARGVRGERAARPPPAVPARTRARRDGLSAPLQAHREPDSARGLRLQLLRLGGGRLRLDDLSARREDAGAAAGRRCRGVLSKDDLMAASTLETHAALAEKRRAFVAVALAAYKEVARTGRLYPAGDAG